MHPPHLPVLNVGAGLRRKLLWWLTGGVLIVTGVIRRFGRGLKINCLGALLFVVRMDEFVFVCFVLFCFVFVCFVVYLFEMAAIWSNVRVLWWDTYTLRGWFDTRRTTIWAG